MAAHRLQLRGTSRNLSLVARGTWHFVIDESAVSETGRTGLYLLQLIMKMHLKSPRDEVENGTRFAFVDKSNGECILHRLAVNEDETTFALLGNLYVCEGKPGRMIKVRAKKRVGNLDFIACMQKALENRYKDKLVGRWYLSCTYLAALANRDER